MGDAKNYERFDAQLEEWEEEEETKDLKCGSTCVNVGSLEKEKYESF